MRGDVYSYVNPRASGHEQRGKRYCVVLQSDELFLSTWVVAPTSTRATPTVFRPEVELLGRTTLVCPEQTTAVNPDRLGELVGRLSLQDLQRVDDALRLVLDL